MSNIIQSKILYSNNLEDVVDYNGKLFVLNKKQKLCVMPYTLKNGMLDKIGVLKYTTPYLSNLEYSLINGIVSSDDDTNLVSANRILFEFINTNASSANIWMYLGKIKSNILDNLGILLYCVNVTDLNIDVPSKLDKSIKEFDFKLINSNDIIATDDSVLLSSYLRLFQFFYINSLNK